MAGSSKKPRRPEAENNGEDGSTSEEESENGTYHGQQEIQATFDGRNLEGHDYHGIKQLLSQLFLKAHIDLGQMTDMLIAQTGVGSVLKQGYNDSDDEEDMELTDDSDVFGITSVLNLTAHPESPCVKQFLSLLEELSVQYAEKRVQDSLKAILSQNPRLGLLINERFVNIPPKVSAVMLNALYSDLQSIQKKDKSYNFDYFVIISKTSKPKSQKDDKEELFTNAEEEVFREASELTFEFSVEKEGDVGLGGSWLPTDVQLIPCRRVMIFKSDKFKEIVNSITVLVQ